MAYVKVKVRDRVREMLVNIDGIYSCSIEKVRKTKAGYDIVVRFDGELSLGVLDEIGQVFGGAGITVSTGYEISGCCELCAGPETYLEVDISGARVTRV